jgi:xanthine dehydrogenase YagR molybdenum-binding subunit
VRVVLTRQQMYVLGHRPAMIQRIAMGAKADGTLDAITHDAVTLTSQYEDYFRQETGWSGLLYTSANAHYAHRLAKLDLPTSCDMRCPSAAPSVYALECAMDELAVALKIDPLELRSRRRARPAQRSAPAARPCANATAGGRGLRLGQRNPAPRDA